MRQIPKRAMDRYVDPETWLAGRRVQDGPWWEAWTTWLGSRSGDPVNPPGMGNAKMGYPMHDDAPGSYVMQK